MSRELGAKLFVSSMVLVALGCFAVAFSNWKSTGVVAFVCYLFVALLASSLKVTLPGIDGTMSVNFLFILLGVLEMSFAETLTLGFAAVLVQCYWRSSKRLRPIQIAFNLAQLTIATSAAYGVYHSAIEGPLIHHKPISLTLAATTYFLFNTLAMACVIALTENKIKGSGRFGKSAISGPSLTT